MEKNICPNCHAENSVKAKYCKECGKELPVIIKEIPLIEVTTPVVKKNKSYRIIIIVAVVLLLLVGAGFGVRSCVNSFIKNHSGEIYDKALTMMADEMNKSCPVMIDQYTRLDNVKVLSGKKMEYNYTLLGTDFSNISPDVLDENILNLVKTHPQMNNLRDLKTTFIYVYKNEEGKELHKYIVTPDMY